LHLITLLPQNAVANPEVNISKFKYHKHKDTALQWLRLVKFWEITTFKHWKRLKIFCIYMSTGDYIDFELFAMMKLLGHLLSNREKNFSVTKFWANNSKPVI